MRKADVKRPPLRPAAGDLRVARCASARRADGTARLHRALITALLSNAARHMSHGIDFDCNKVE
jgi:hypothetical protein